MKPKFAIATIENSTYVFLDGKCISGGVTDLIYSAKNEQGNLKPTLKLLEVDINEFSFEDGISLEEFLDKTQEVKELFETTKTR